MSSTSFIRVVLSWATPGSEDFSETKNMCSSKSYVILGMNGIGFIFICFLW